MMGAISTAQRRATRGGLRRCLLLASTFLLATGVTSNAADLSASAIEQISAIMADKAARTPAQRKIDSRLLDEQRNRFPAIVSPNNAPALRTGVKVDADNRVLMDVTADVTPALLKAMTQFGAVIVSSSERFSEVRAIVPLAQIEALASRADVTFVEPAREAMVNMINVSEGDVAHAADQTRAIFGVDGSGIRIGVMSDAVDALGAVQASGDLPGVTVLPGQAGSGGSEGTAMLEIVFDLAPGSDLYFATAFGGFANFAQNILDLRAAGSDIIVDDIFYFAESPFQDDIISQAVNTVTADGAAYFSSAGNSGNFNDGTSGTWEGDYVDGGAAGPIFGAGGRLHDWGGTTLNQITAGSPFAYTLHWSDALGASANDYDLYLINAAGTAVIGASTSSQTGTQNPYEQIGSSGAADNGAFLAVLNFNGAQPRFLHLSTLRGRTAINTAGETKGHATADNAFGVAAVDVATAGGGVFTGGPANPVETFSSDGPRQIFYEPDGSPVTPGNFLSSGGRVRAKPDITAADGVATATPGFNPFFGTSAAAPHAAAIAALVLQRNANANLRTIFNSTALDIEAPGPDRDSGVGIIQADLATGAAVTHPCCTIGTAGCIDPVIQDAVCAEDSFCCNVAWDSLCVEEVTTIANDNCDCCEISDNAEGCFDDRALGGPFSAWSERFSAERALYAVNPDAFRHSGRETVMIQSGANLAQPTRVQVDRSPVRPSTMLSRTLIAETFPSIDSDVVSDNFPPAGELGYFWSVSRGDSVTQTFIPNMGGSAGQINRAVFDFSVPTNGLSSVGVDWNVRINGQTIGGFTIGVGQTGPVNVDLSFPPVVSFDGAYTVRFEVTNEVPVGAGAHTFGANGTVQLIGEFTDDVQSCICAADSYCCEENWDSICVAEVEAFGCGLCEGCDAPLAPFGPNPADTQANVLPDQDLYWNDTGDCRIDNGGFESGNFAGWNVRTDNAAVGELTPWNVGTGPGIGFFANAFPFEGLLFAQNGFDGGAGLAYQISQDIAIPAGTGSAVLNWSERIQWDLLNFASPTQPREYIVTLQPAGGGAPIATLYSMNLDPLTVGDTGYVARSIDLLAAAPGIAGTTVRVNWFQYVPENLSGPAQFELDGVEIFCAAGSAQGIKRESIAGSRSTAEREAHWRAAFAQKVAAYRAVQRGDKDVSSLAPVPAATAPQLKVPDGFVIEAGAAVEADKARPAPSSAPAQGARGADAATRALGGTLINFDDVAAPCFFSDATRLTDRYTPLGVTFLGPGGLDGGAILDECGLFGVTGQSSPNFLAFNSLATMADGGIPTGPQTMLFDPPVSKVVAKAGAGFASGSITMTAYDALGVAVASVTNSTFAPELAGFSLQGEGIVRVVIETALTDWVLDELRFEACPVSYDVLFGTDPFDLLPLPECQGVSEPACLIDPLAEGALYYWQVVANSGGGTTPGPVWSFTTAASDVDSDGDGVGDSVDNCVFTVNPSQRDTDGDGHGNRCDADLNNDCVVNPIDLGLFKSRFFTVDADADFNGDGIVNPQDLGIFRLLFFSVPGPSAPPNLCNNLPAGD